MSLFAALAYLRAGASVLPVDRQKRPLLGQWKEYQSRRPTVDEVRRWYGRWRGAGVAIVCGAISDLVVLDVEREGLWALDDHHVPYVPTVTTQGGGRHFYFRYNPHLRSTNWREFGCHLGELRSDGNIVVAPPSEGELGQYEWLASPEDWPLVEVPPWIERLTAAPRPRSPGAVVPPVSRRPSPLRPPPTSRPSRSEDDLSLALELVLRGRPLDDIAEALRARPAALDRGQNGPQYVERTVARAYSFASERYHPAVVQRVLRHENKAAVSFRIVEGPHRGRVLRKPYDWPPSDASRPFFEELGVGGDASQLVALIGTDVAIRVFDEGTHLRLGRAIRRGRA